MPGLCQAVFSCMHYYNVRWGGQDLDESPDARPITEKGFSEIMARLDLWTFQAGLAEFRSRDRKPCRRMTYVAIRPPTIPWATSPLVLRVVSICATTTRRRVQVTVATGFALKTLVYLLPKLHMLTFNFEQVDRHKTSAARTNNSRLVGLDRFRLGLAGTLTG